MTMTNRVPDWLTPIAAAFVALALLSAVAIAFDIYGRGRRHRTLAAELVWISSALYLGPFALWLYQRYGRSTSQTITNTAPASVAGLPGGGASAMRLDRVLGLLQAQARGLAQVLDRLDKVAPVDGLQHRRRQVESLVGHGRALLGHTG